jgi:hypothetical protein
LTRKQNVFRGRIAGGDEMAVPALVGVVLDSASIGGFLD